MTKERIDEYLKRVEEAMENNMDEQDFFDDLAEAGFTLKEFEGTPFYEMVKEYTKTHAWEK